MEDALQSVVYLLLDLMSITVESHLPPDRDNSRLLWFCDGAGKVCGSVFDLVWWRWIDGEPPSVLGQHELRLAVPSRWRSLAGAEGQPVSITAMVNVVGYIITVPGQAERYALVDATDKAVECFRMRATFDTAQKSYPVVTFATESDLEAFLDSRPATVTASLGRIRLPRIRCKAWY